MDKEAALRQLAAALSAGDMKRSRDAGLRAARQVLIDHCLLALGKKAGDAAPIDTVMRLAADADDPPARRDCALLMVHALGVRALVPAAASAAACLLVESGLRPALIRGGYPFNGSMAEKMAFLESLHRTIGELMQPYEPTFPNWQGLYAG